MFTGIIETTGEILQVIREGSNTHFDVKSSISNQLAIDQSVSHQGVCLTVIKSGNGAHRVTTVEETLNKSNLGLWKVGAKVNLERSMPALGRFDGHLVQGHVDQTGKVKSIRDEKGSWVFEFTYNPGLENITVEKGSICVNGVSLTCINSKDGAFSVAVIPYTYQNTTFKLLLEGDVVNLEFDIIGKYVRKLLIK